MIAAVADIRNAIGFSSFAVLTYYAVANASAYTLDEGERRWPRWLAGCGVAGCGILAFSLPVTAVIGGSALLIVGAVVFMLSRKPDTRSVERAASPDRNEAPPACARKVVSIRLGKL